jgi:hypothetical protein
LKPCEQAVIACRNRKVTMSDLIDPTVNLNFYQISNRGSRLSADAQEFHQFLKGVYRQLGEHFDRSVAISRTEQMSDHVGGIVA